MRIKDFYIILKKKFLVFYVKNTIVLYLMIFIKGQEDKKHDYKFTR